MTETFQRIALRCHERHVGEGDLSVVDIPDMKWTLRVTNGSFEERCDGADVTRKQKDVHSTKLWRASDTLD
ncbi:hypothetical protein GCM10009808_20920 [Microbacterium sediminicola]|uniref:Uncharacterized protein n=1 Tax=Microbacterium sediminicola TaxID=415210 RepID=A0ABN2IDQ0_9MICO